MWVHPEADAVAADEAIHLELFVFGLVADSGESSGGRLVAGRLEDAAEQDRHIVEGRSRARLDRRDDLVAEEGVRAAEIEQEFGIAHHFSP